MSFQEKFELVRESLISYCKECITTNWERMFDMWLSFEADHEFGNGYKDMFKEHFSQYMNSQIEESLWFAGKNIIFAINAFRSYKNDATLDDILYFTEKFVSEQLDDFNNWCDDISMSMYEETSEYEEDCNNRKEDNPS
jgi:hypothetical protein